MLKIKLSRTGKRNQPSFRIVVAEAKSKRDGKNVEIIGYYDPLADEFTCQLDQQKYLDWIQKGAQPTPTVKDLYNKVASSTK